MLAIKLVDKYTRDSLIVANLESTRSAKRAISVASTFIERKVARLKYVNEAIK